jgi:hypothetical protein
LAKVVFVMSTVPPKLLRPPLLKSAPLFTIVLRWIVTVPRLARAAGP